MKQVKKTSSSPSLTLTAQQVVNVAEVIAAQLKQDTITTQVNESAAAQNLFNVLMRRFDTVDVDNLAIKNSLIQHVEDDNKVHKVVEQHKTYWGITIKVLLGFISGAFLIFITWFGMH